MAVDADSQKLEDFRSKASKKNQDASLSDLEKKPDGSAGGKPVCDMCVQGDVAIRQCKVCDAVFCHECWKFHSRNKLTYLHPTQTIEEWEQERTIAKSKEATQNEADDSDVVIIDDDSSVLDDMCKIDKKDVQIENIDKQADSCNNSDLSGSKKAEIGSVSANAMLVDECQHAEPKDINENDASSDHSYVHDTEDDDLDIKRLEKAKARMKTLPRQDQKNSSSEHDKSSMDSSKVCSKCKMKMVDAPIVVCTGCQQVWHITCVETKETKSSQTGWQCETCRSSKPKRSRIRRIAPLSDSESSVKGDSDRSSESWSDGESKKTTGDAEVQTGGRLTRAESRRLGIEIGGKAKKPRKEQEAEKEDSLTSSSSEEEPEVWALNDDLLNLTFPQGLRKRI
eukprot:754881-Hanusia_phi.AAC.3